MEKPLENYLRTYRRRSGLLQRELAVLLNETRATVTRHESGLRMPPLDVALAYEVILGISVRDLFAGRYHAVEATVRERAEHLLATLRETPGDHSPQKLDVLSGLVDIEEPVTIPIWEE